MGPSRSASWSVAARHRLPGRPSAPARSGGRPRVREVAAPSWMLLAARERELDLGAPVLEVEPRRDRGSDRSRGRGPAAGRSRACAGAACGPARDRGWRSALVVRGDVAPDEPDLPPRTSAYARARLARPSRSGLDLGAVQDDAGFDALEELVVAPGTPVVRDQLLALRPCHGISRGGRRGLPCVRDEASPRPRRGERGDDRPENLPARRRADPGGVPDRRDVVARQRQVKARLCSPHGEEAAPNGVFEDRASSRWTRATKSSPTVDGKRRKDLE